MIFFKPIGTIRTPFANAESVPTQSAMAGVSGKVELQEQYRNGLKDLDGFSHIILIYQLHQSFGFDLEVVPDREKHSRGLFATRVPKRPNAIGFTVVEFDKIENGMLYVNGVDIVDGTPLLDIKPYIPSTDSIPDAKTGWMGKAGKTPKPKK